MMRGAITGLQKGMYNERSFTLDEKCLGETTTNAISQLMDPIKSHNPEAETTVFYESITSVYHILGYNDRYCDMEGFLIDFFEYCFANEDKPCGFSVMLERAQKDMFKLVAKINDIAMRASEDRPEDLEEYEDFWTAYGQDIGEVVDSLTLFSKSNSM